MELYQHPAMQAYDYYWRLDSDSFLISRGFRVQGWGFGVGFSGSGFGIWDLGLGFQDQGFVFGAEG